jgi:hypothetical protein
VEQIDPTIENAVHTSKGLPIDSDSGLNELEIFETQDSGHVSSTPFHSGDNVSPSVILMRDATAAKNRVSAALNPTSLAPADTVRPHIHIQGQLAQTFRGEQNCRSTYHYHCGSAIMDWFSFRSNGDM